jgi:actin related protein 2/3 complex subunit 5
MSLEDWRRIDVDQYDPENQYEADELPNLKPNTSINDIQTLTQQLRGLIQRMDIKQALLLSIEYAPYGATQDVRDAYLQSIYEIFISVKTNDVANIINNIDIDALDVVVKFIYTLMSKEWALRQSGLLLIWLDKIVELVGEGPIIRYMSDPYKI